jgi:hypothetical protein
VTVLTSVQTDADDIDSDRRHGQAWLVEQPSPSPVDEPRPVRPEPWARNFVRELPREPIRYDDGSRNRRLLVVIASGLLTLLLVSVFAAWTIVVLVNGGIWFLPALVTLITATGTFWGLREEVRRPYEGHLTSSGDLRLVSLAGIQEGSLQSVRRVSWRSGRDSGPYFVIQWEHGRTKLKPSRLVEWMIDAHPAIEVRRYTTRRRRAVRQRLGP